MKKEGPCKLPESQQCLSALEWGAVACSLCEEQEKDARRKVLLDDVLSEIEFKRGFNL